MDDGHIQPKAIDPHRQTDEDDRLGKHPYLGREQQTREQDEPNRAQRPGDQRCAQAVKGAGNGAGGDALPRAAVVSQCIGWRRLFGRFGHGQRSTINSQQSTENE